MENKMFPEERIKLIFNILKEKKKVYVNELAKELSMSKSTIRMDLAELELRGLINRTHGGAVLKNESLIDITSEMDKNSLGINYRIQKNQAEKNAIGKLAASLVNNGDTIMIDGGSTTQFVAKHLCTKSGLTIITNSFYMLPELMNAKESAIYLAGGMVYKENAILMGDLTNEFVSHFKPQKLFLGIDGISLDQGLTVADSMYPSVASIKRKMIDACSQLIVVADHTKIGRVCLMPIAPLEKVNYLVTDDNASREKVEAIKSVGPEVLLAGI
jgi:DeoR/GlpR family transcriptional regulator of sugar metabolism